MRTGFFQGLKGLPKVNANRVLKLSCRLKEMEAPSYMVRVCLRQLRVKRMEHSAGTKGCLKLKGKRAFRGQHTVFNQCERATQDVPSEPRKTLWNHPTTREVMFISFE